MNLTVFRNLPGVAAVEKQLDMHFRDRLLDDEIDELPCLIDETSISLFGITRRDTFYWALPDPVRVKYDRAEWESNFDILWQHSREPNQHWRAFGLDVCCEDGSALHCLEVFGRQLVCALNCLHPQADLVFRHVESSRAA